MKKQLVIFVAVFLSAVCASERGYTYWTRESAQQHMFSFGDEAGDEKIMMANLPLTKDLNDKIIFNRGKFDQIKIFKEGYIELHNENVNIEFTPIVAPSSIPYSIVKSGHVWYRENNDRATLDSVASEIEKTTNLIFNLKSVKVITWEIQEVEARYPECFPENRDANIDFCNCLDSIHFDHLACECQYLFDNEWTHDMVCSCVQNVADFRYCDCDDFSGHRPFDTKNYCICEARGGSVSAGVCVAVTHNLFFGGGIGGGNGVLQAVEGCDFCGCDEPSKPGYCHCYHIDAYIAHDKRSCFLLFAANKGLCFMSHIWCPDVRTCSAAGNNRSSMCDCILPASPTELDLLQCLLSGNKHQYIWLCDDPEENALQYCSCMESRTQNNEEDEIYCKCWAVNLLTGSDEGEFCDCLNGQNYTGSEAPHGCSKRSTKLDEENHRYSSDEVRATAITKRDEPAVLNRFQAIIAHDKRNTFVYITFGRLEYHDKYTKTKIGHVKHDTSTFVGYEHPYPQHIFLRLFMLWDSNMGMKGRWVYKVNGRVIWQPDWTPEDGTIEYRYPHTF